MGLKYSIIVIIEFFIFQKRSPPLPSSYFTLNFYHFENAYLDGTTTTTTTTKTTIKTKLLILINPFFVKYKSFVKQLSNER